MEWIDQPVWAGREQPGPRNSYKRSLQPSTLPRPSAKTHLYSRNVVSVNSVQNSYSYKCLEACYLILSFTYTSKMVRISRFSPADPSVEIAVRGMLPILNFPELWVVVTLCLEGRALSWWPGEVASVLMPGFPPGRARFCFFLTHWAWNELAVRSRELTSHLAEWRTNWGKWKNKKKSNRTLPLHSSFVLLHFPFLLLCLFPLHLSAKKI